VSNTCLGEAEQALAVPVEDRRRWGSREGMWPDSRRQILVVGGRDYRMYRDGKASLDARSHPSWNAGTTAERGSSPESIEEQVLVASCRGECWRRAGNPLATGAMGLHHLQPYDYAGLTKWRSTAELAPTLGVRCVSFSAISLLLLARIGGQD
jgi:hypothetical protein